MSSNNRNRRWVGGVGMAVSAAFTAALIGLANAPAASADDVDSGGPTVSDPIPHPILEGQLPDPFQELFGNTGFNSWTPSADSFLLSTDPTQTLAGNLDTIVDNFLIGMDGTGDDPFSTLVSEFDPSAFTFTSEILGPQGDLVTVPVPLDATGDVALGLDLTGFSVGLDTFGNPLALGEEILFAPLYFLLLPAFAASF
jgi:hypothetical protein